MTIRDCGMAKKVSKHKKRRDRRFKYYEMLDRELSSERYFQGRVVETINRKGLDIAPDGRPIKADWWDYMKSRDRSRINNAYACLYLMELVIRSLRPEGTN